MKILKIIFLMLAFPLVSATSEHKFYVSITKMEYVKEKNSLQIITKIFIDDIEDALQQEYNHTVSLNTSKETMRADGFLKEYILKKIAINVNGKPVQLNYIGKEYDTDVLIAYIEIVNISELQTIEIQNNILMEVFEEQQNIIHLKTPNSRRSLILDKDSPKGTLDF